MKSLIALSLALAVTGLAQAVSARTEPPTSSPECVAGASVDDRLAAILAKPDRSDRLKSLDAARDSENRFLLQYVKPGDHVLDLGAGGGYSSWLLSSAVCSGSVDAQNPADWVSDANAQAAWTATTTARPNIHAVTSPFTAVPAPAQPYDVIFIGTIYHDTYNEDGADAVAMDKSLLADLKPGGVVVVIDHNAVPGSGAAATDTLHRIDKAQVLSDFKAAGFELVSDSDALANPADDHTLKVFDPLIRGKTDRMALVFRKP